MKRLQSPWILAMLAAVFACAAGTVTADTAPTVSGAPSNWEPGNSPATILPCGLDDTLRPLAGSPACPLSAPAPCEPADLEETSQVSVALWERLAAVSSEARAGASIELELGRDAAPADLATARAVEALWNGGRCEGAIAMLRELEEAGACLGLGIGWANGAGPASSSRDADVRIGGDRTGARAVSVDFDEQSGNLFSVIGWGSAEGDAYWTMNVSTDHGASWTETYAWYSTTGIIDVDAAVVYDWVYVGYVAGGSEDEVRMRRCHANTGGVDGLYSYHVVLDAGSNTFTEVVMAANADDFDNRIYCLAIESNRDLRMAWDIASDGTTFVEVTPPVSPHASRGLDATFDNNLVCDEFLYASYLGTDGNIHVQKLESGDMWTDDIIATGAYASTNASISAFGEVIICAYNIEMTDGYGIQYRISYDCGVTWTGGNLAEPDDIIHLYLRPSVDARNGLGTAVAFEAQTGAPDEALYRFRYGFAPGSWSAPVVFNDQNVSAGVAMVLGPLSHGADHMDHGAVYITDTLVPYFDMPNPASSSAPAFAAPASTLQLLPVSPNPADGGTTIRFVLPAAGHVRLELLDVLGRHVATLLDGPLDAGMHAIPVAAERLGSGICFYRLVSGDQEAGSRIAVIR
jgi:hypothetical protein